VDFSEDGVNNNEFLVVNQFTVIENNNNKRPDILLFINGIPMVLFELKNPAVIHQMCMIPKADGTEGLL